MRPADCARFPWFLVITGWWKTYQQRLRRITPKWLLLAALGGAGYGFAWGLVTTLVDLALRLNRQAFGFEDQSWTAWLLQESTSVAVLSLVGLVALPILYALMIRSPKRWPVWLGSAAIVLTMSAIIIQPLTADTTQLPRGALRDGIEKMLHDAGRPDAPIVLTRDSGPCVGGRNLGMFPTTRIIIDGGYLQYPVSQGVETAAHELGHYVRHDPDLGVLVGVVWLSIGLYALYRTEIGLRGRAIESKNTVLTDSHSIPMMAFCIALVYVCGLPIFNAIQRRVEHRADAYAMALTHDGSAGIAGMTRDMTCDRLDPYPGWWARTFFWDHPSISERIKFMEGFRADVSHDGKN